MNNRPVKDMTERGIKLNSLERVDSIKTAPATITDVRDARKLLFIAEELVVATRKEYRASDRVSEVKEDRDRAYNTAVKAGELRLLAEAKLGELLKKQEFDKGGRPSKTGNNKVTGFHLEDIGLDKMDSYRAQRIAEHQNLIPKVVAKAVQRGDIPTRKDIEFAIREVKEEELKKEYESIPLPQKKYRTIVVDPPWPIEKILREERPHQDVWAYRKMSIDEITNFPIKQLIHPGGSHLYLWTTHKFLPISFQIIESWGFKYQCLLTWIRNVGITPFSWMYSTEHILFCRAGSLDLLVKGQRLDFSAKVREHSRKPNEFYNLVKTVSPELRIDVFSTEKRDGFEQYGDEQNKFSG